MPSARCIRLGAPLLGLSAGQSLYDALLSISQNGSGSGGSIYLQVEDTDDVNLSMTGTGTQSDPFLISASLINTPEGAYIDVVDTDDVALNLTGNGLASNPYELSATLVNGVSLIASPQSATIAPATNTAILYQSPDLSSHISYSTGSGVITFLTAGKYLIGSTVGFTANQAWGENTPGQSVFVKLFATHNTTNLQLDFLPIPIGASYPDELVLSGQVIVNVAVNDTLRFSVYHNSSSKALSTAGYSFIEKVG